MKPGPKYCRDCIVCIVICYSILSAHYEHHWFRYALLATRRTIHCYAINGVKGILLSADPIQPQSKPDIADKIEEHLTDSSRQTRANQSGQAATRMRAFMLRADVNTSVDVKALIELSRH